MGPVSPVALRIGRPRLLGAPLWPVDARGAKEGREIPGGVVHGVNSPPPLFQGKACCWVANNPTVDVFFCSDQARNRRNRAGHLMHSSPRVRIRGT